MKVLFDSNIIIDGITKRENSLSSSRELLIKVAEGSLEGFLASKQITDIYYILRKYVSDVEKRRDFVQTLLRAFVILPVTQKTLQDALLLQGQDYEDNVLIQCCRENNIGCIVTMNTKDFLESDMDVELPTELIHKVNI